MADPPQPKENVGGRKKIRNPYLKKKSTDSARGGSCYGNDNLNTKDKTPLFNKIQDLLLQQQIRGLLMLQIVIFRVRVFQDPTYTDAI